MFKWKIPVLMLSCRFRKFMSQIVGKTFKVNAWVGFVKKEIRFRSIRNSTNKQQWQREIQVCESFLSICDSLSMLALSVNPKCFRSEFQLEWNSVLFVSESCSMKWNTMVRWRNSLKIMSLEQCFERENYMTNFINISVVVIFPVRMWFEI